ncbi:MAG: TFIIB-type zinc ribbon-containing protein [Clostridia bacterium]|nr:TFIIB-type zinc ribbon-containing protein [Clostridia bacterium]
MTRDNMEYVADNAPNIEGGSDIANAAETNNGTLAYNCPNCGAELYFDADKQKMCCEFCESEFTTDELAGTNAHESAEAARINRDEYCAHMNEYECPNCGAEIVADENTAADICAYCHSPIVLKGRLSGQMRPDKVISFKYGKEEAVNRFVDFAKKKWFAPKDFKSHKHAEMLVGIYYPFWVTDADTDSTLEANATKVRVWRRGNVEYTETSRYRVYRRGNIHFEDIVTSAYSEADKKMLEGILPYPSDALVPFDATYLSGFTAKKRDIERASLTEEVRGRMNEYAEKLLRDTIGGYSTVNVDRKQVSVMSSHWEYSLLPIWLLTYTPPKKDGKKKKVYTYAMNGHTGKIYGEIPISFGKVAAFCSAVFAVAAPIIAMIGGVLL